MQNSDEESSPWDSPLSSTRDPVKRRDKLTKIKDLEPKSSWDSEKEKWKGHGDAQENSNPTPKQDGAWIDIDLSSTRISRRCSEEVNQTSRKSPCSVKVEGRRLPLEDFKGALNVVADREPMDQPAPLPLKNPRGAAYRPSEPEDSHADLSSWTNSAKDATLHSPSQKLSANQNPLPSCPGPGDTLNKRNFSSVEARGRKSVEGSEVKREEELKEFRCINHGSNMEPVYTEPDPGVQERIEVSIVTDLVSYKDDLHMYRFDYGHKHYFRVRKETEEAYMMQLADSSEKLIRRGWREVFGLLRIFINIITVFLIETISFLSKFVFQVLAVGLMTALGDHMVKPFLVTLFNSLLQPLFIFLLNVCSSLQSLADPLIEVLRGLSMQLAFLLRAFRLVEVHVTPKQPNIQLV
ncbi:uncharacterized protein LOC115099412 [Rhinatrema bivittatum]|uniref:uncharacterized protein LOC115099412 n=1 Tax=Rhinatrema bivittatum TaxID=194408 RepID=UPI00112B96B2|nr:uncharacterized protein LOC115099412 [Rhinatrema bivittatum]